MDPGFDTLDDLGTYIRGYTKEFLNDNGLASQLHIPIDLPPIGLNGKARHNLLLVIKEALHNIVKHAEATEVDFKLEINDQLLITIADNGKGFDPAKLKRRGSGLKNMKKRIQSIGGEINWEPNSSQGTKVVVKYPIVPTT
jgi:signal transduction histidine kinase